MTGLDYRELTLVFNLTVSPSRPQRAAGVDHQAGVEDAEEMRRFRPVPVQLPVEVLRKLGAPLGEDVLAEAGVLGRTPHLVDGLDPVLGGVGRVVEILKNHRRHRVGRIEGPDLAPDGAVNVVQRVDLVFPEILFHQ